MPLSRGRLYWERTTAFAHKVMLAFQSSEQREKHAARFRQETFARITREERWGRCHLSGGGSTFEYTTQTKKILEKILREYDVKSMLHAGCGDFAWMPRLLDRLPGDFRYVGTDIVPQLIEAHSKKYPQYEFKVVDFVVDELPSCELIFCRDALQHLPIKDALTALEKFSRSGARYLLTTTHLRRVGWKNSRDKRVGQCNDRNLLHKPFFLADPIVIFSERDAGHKFLGLWELPLESVGEKELARTAL